MAGVSGDASRHGRPSWSGRNVFIVDPRNVSERNVSLEGMVSSTRIQRRVAQGEPRDWPEHIHPVLRRVYAARGALHPGDVEYRLAALYSPQSLSGIDSACELLAKALRDDLHIVIVGDFDADGATGTAVAWRGLRALGAQRVSYQVPNRFTHGYGLSPALVETLLPRKPELIITVDNGIASLAGVALAKRHGVAVLITDHHLPGMQLPAADAIVNPNLESDAFPSKALCGVGVMFYLLLALRAHLRRSGWFAERRIVEPDLSVLLDLVALGTVADLVPLDFNNRILVEAGIKRIRAGRSCAGVSALINASNRHAQAITTADLGFALAPRINAAGRLEDMALGIECLITDDVGRAQALAEQLSVINAERRELQITMIEQGEALVARWRAMHDAVPLPVGVCLFEADWHPGVVGLVASRLKDLLHRPVVACAPAGDGSNELRASARSIAGFHIRDALVEVDARHPGLILRFGGHAMAAGLSLSADGLDTFAAAFNAVACERLAPEQLEAVVLSDGELKVEDCTLALAQQLRFAGPWGQSFPEPVFDGEFTLESWHVVGETHLRLKLRPVSGAAALEAMMFGAYRGSAPPPRLRAAYQLDINDWRGESSLRLLLRHIEAV